MLYQSQSRKSVVFGDALAFVDRGGGWPVPIWPISEAAIGTETLPWSDMSCQRHHSTEDKQTGRNLFYHKFSSQMYTCFLYCALLYIICSSMRQFVQDVTSSWRFKSLPRGIGFSCGASCCFLHACCLSFLRALLSRREFKEHVNIWI